MEVCIEHQIFVLHWRRSIFSLASYAIPVGGYQASKCFFKPRVSDVPILADRLHYLFTNPGCTGNAAHLINDDVLLADQDGHTILFSFRSLTIVYDFGRILQSQSVRDTKALTFSFQTLLGMSRQCVQNPLPWTLAFVSHTDVYRSIAAQQSKPPLSLCHVCFVFARHWSFISLFWTRTSPFDRQRC